MSAALRVFTSSTFRDLQADRAAVREVVDALARAGHAICWVGMEAFGALATSPLLASEEFAEHADLVVLLLGDQYGSYSPEEPFSFTHAEWKVVRRDRIPCLAYQKQVDESALGKEIADLRKQVAEELVCATYENAKDLAAKVRRDLERELRAIPAERDALGLTISPPAAGNTEVFAGRERELARLAEALDEEQARIGIWGPPGIGKTTFVRRFFSGSDPRLLEPLWLRTDDLFATDAAGRRRLEALRWNRGALLERLKELWDAHPRGVFVFDNVQAAPLLVRWLAARMGAVPCLFLAWDAEALPGCRSLLRLPPLAREESRRLFEVQIAAGRGDAESADRLCSQVGDYPLLLDLCIRRLALDPALTIEELGADLERAEDRLGLQGPTIDQAEVNVRRVFVSSYLRLDPGERQALGVLAACPAEGISQQTMAWAVGAFSRGEFRRLERATALGFVEGRPYRDWRGHRYYVRTIIGDFLRTTDGYPQAAETFQRYLETREALEDESSDIVASALTSQLARSRPALPWNADWLEALIFESRPQLAAHAVEVLRRVRDAEQVDALAQRLVALLSTPRLEEPTLAALRLLAEWKAPSAEFGLRHVWREPIACDEEGETFYLYGIRVEAGRALAALRGQSFEDFLRDALRSPNPRERILAMEAAGEARELDVREEILAALDDPSTRIRQAALDALGNYEPDAHLQDSVWRLLQTEHDEATRRCAVSALGIWKDERIRPLLLADLDYPDAEVRATAISVLWRFPRAEVADRLAVLAIADPAPEVRQNAAFVLADFFDPRAAEVALRHMSSEDPTTQRLGMFAVSRLSHRTLSGATRDALCARLAATLATAPIETRLVARAALLSLRDARGYEGLWGDLALEAARQHPSFRWYALHLLATWRPPNFDPEPLRMLLHDRDPAMRRTACLVAGQARAWTLASDLQSLLGDESMFRPAQETVANAASEALDRIAGKRPPWEPHPNARPPAHA